MVEPVAEVTGGRRGRERIDRHLFPALPSAPLAVAVNRLIRRERVGLNVLGLKISDAKGNRQGRDSAREIVCERLGFNQRRLYAWEMGEAKTIQFDTADRILQKADWLWFDVWEPCPGDNQHYRDVAETGTCQRCEDYCTAEEAFTSERTGEELPGSQQQLDVAA